MTTERIGIIDLGSNSCRFVIYDIYEDGAYHPIFEMKRNIRLAAHLDKEARISPDGLAKAIHCTKLFYRAGSMYGVTDWIAVATAAVRQAQNQTEFLAALKKETSVSFRVLQGEEEGRYGYLGVINTLDIQDALLFDIGGASMELMYIFNRRLLQVVSLPYGAVTLTAQFKEVPADLQGDQVYRFMQQQFLEIPWLTKLRNLPLVGLGGAARALAKLDRSKNDQLSKRIHGYQISLNSLRNMYQEIKSSPLKDRKKIKGLSRQRADILVAGFAAIQALADQISAQTIIVSRSGLREGIAFEYLLRENSEPIVASVLDYSLANFQKLFKINTNIATLVTNAALYLFDSLQQVHGLSEFERKLLQVTSQIESCGCYINTEKWTRHSAYLTLSSHLHGLQPSECEQIAGLLCGKNDPTLRKLSLLIRLAKLAILQSGIEIENLTCTVEENRVWIGKAPGMRSIVANSADADLGTEFKKVFGVRLEYMEL
ncbi:Ppx/GppA family phosphatase [Effusibacillus dendaii]|uniref:Exopolyphosphatase n=1 Tax=Effusibacillus dendaii TaxID=2743772 RepID=A0A7I8D9S5_9BACL|nr:Ppx/GppA family phosphatase [Effusibacillus dendaii]BCJ85576.1 exopolyphosphatase [Effusibacillus dendaii]